MRNPFHHCLTIAAAGALLTTAGLCAQPAGLAGRAAIPDPASPPPWTEIPAATRRHFNLGHMVFNATWQPAGHDSQLVGLGPLFVENSCAACHPGGARGLPPAAPGGLSSSFVMQLGGPATAYGNVLNTRAIEGHQPEGRVTVTLQQREGRHADGQRWTLREPRYVVDSPRPGLPADAVLKPRIGSQVFGVGLLDAVPLPALEAIRNAQAPAVRGEIGGRFGWQGTAMSLVDQTAIAFAREMGLTSGILPSDDCTPAQAHCLEAPQAGTPELPEDLFHAVNTFQFMLAAPARGQIDPAAETAGAALFERAGCAACHVPQLPVPRDAGEIRIDPYTDLLLHDLGEGLADRTVAGTPVTSRWRTAPLWGLAHALQAGPVGLLHDGRASSVEEAILWHEGQGAAARRAFMAMDASSRRQLLAWVESL